MRTRSRPAWKWSACSLRGLTASVGYQYLRGENLLMSVNQNVPTCVAAGTNNGCRPNAALPEQQPVFVGRRVDLSRAARLVRAAADHVGERSRHATRCRSR